MVVGKFVRSTWYVTWYVTWAGLISLSSLSWVLLISIVFISSEKDIVSRKCEISSMVFLPPEQNIISRKCEVSPSEENKISGKCEVSSIVPPSPLGTPMQDIPVDISTRPEHVIQCPLVSRTLKQIHYVKKPPSGVTTYMDVALINVRSINKNGYKVKDYVVGRDCDITAITETWLTDEQDRTTQIVNNPMPQGVHNAPSIKYHMAAWRWCGTAPQEGNHHQATNSWDLWIFENSEHMLKQSSIWIRIIVLYRPPPSTENGLINRQFLTELSSFLKCQIILPSELLVFADFNIHIDDPNDYYANEFQSLLETFDLTQLVRQPNP